MAWGYGSDHLSWGVVVSVFIQVALFVMLVSGSFRQRTLRRSPWLLVVLAAAVVLNQALLELLSPSFGVGITSGALTLFVVIPLSVLNAVLVAVRSATRGARAPLFLPFLFVVTYWVWRVVSFARPATYQEPPLGVEAGASSSALQGSTPSAERHLMVRKRGVGVFVTLGS
jgi:uncharacterized membrane-anchored protein